MDWILLEKQDRNFLRIKELRNWTGLDWIGLDRNNRIGIFKELSKWNRLDWIGTTGSTSFKEVKTIEQDWNGMEQQDLFSRD